MSLFSAVNQTGYQTFASTAAKKSFGAETTGSVARNEQPVVNTRREEQKVASVPQNYNNETTGTLAYAQFNIGFNSSRLASMNATSSYASTVAASSAAGCSTSSTSSIA